jgi:hypothetical protein
LQRLTQSLKDTGSYLAESTSNLFATTSGWIATVVGNALAYQRQWMSYGVDTFRSKTCDGWLFLSSVSAKYAMELGEFTKKALPETSSRVLSASSALSDRLRSLSQITSIDIGTVDRSVWAHISSAAAQLSNWAIGFAELTSSLSLPGTSDLLEMTTDVADMTLKLLAESVGMMAGVPVGLARASLQLTSEAYVQVSPYATPIANALTDAAATVVVDWAAMKQQARVSGAEALSAFNNLVENSPTREEFVATVRAYVDAATALIPHLPLDSARRAIEELRSISRNVMEPTVMKAYASSQTYLSDAVSEALKSLCGTLFNSAPSVADLAVESNLCVRPLGICRGCRLLPW